MERIQNLECDMISGTSVPDVIFYSIFIRDLTCTIIRSFALLWSEK
jgi:hypothetical protein